MYPEKRLRPPPRRTMEVRTGELEGMAPTEYRGPELTPFEWMPQPPAEGQGQNPFTGLATRLSTRLLTPNESEDDTTPLSGTAPVSDSVTMGHEAGNTLAPPKAKGMYGDAGRLLKGLGGKIKGIF